MNAKGLVFDDNIFMNKYKSVANTYRKRNGSQLGMSY